MKQIIRFLIALFAIAGAISWTWLLLALTHWSNSMAGIGDGAGTGSPDVSPLAVLFIALVWLLPTAAFVFMLCITLNLLKDKLRRIAYWYSLIFMIIATGLLMVLYPGIRIIRLVGMIFLFFTALWGFSFWRIASTRRSSTSFK